MCVCVEHVCPILGQGGVLVFLLLFPLVTLLFPRPPLCIQHIPLGRLLLRAPSRTHTHSHVHAHTHAHSHMDPGGKSLLRRPCPSSYGAVVREMERQLHLRAPAANDIFRPFRCWAAAVGAVSPTTGHWKSIGHNKLSHFWISSRRTFNYYSWCLMLALMDATFVFSVSHQLSCCYFSLWGICFECEPCLLCVWLDVVCASSLVSEDRHSQDVL